MAFPKSPRPIGSLVALIAVAAIGLLLAIRLGVSVWNAETGLESLQAHWRGQTIDWFAPETPLHEQLPIDQAKSWLKEVDRIVAKHQDDPEILMGAAIVLAQPCGDFVGRQFPPRESQTIEGISIRFKRDEGGIEKARSQFEAAVSKRRAELASQACKLAPTNANLVRLRAILASQAAERKKGVRGDAELDATLAECRSADPGNALYDYLAAFHAWENSTRYVSSSEGGFYEPTDRALYARCFEWIEEGKKQPQLSEGIHEATLMAKFLDLTQAPSATKYRVLGDWRLESHRFQVDRFLFRAQYQLVREAELAGKFREAMEKTVQWDHFGLQSERGEIEANLIRPQSIFRLMASTNRRWLARKHADAFTAAEQAGLRDEERQSRIAIATMSVAAADWSTPGQVKLLNDLMTQRPGDAAVSLVVGIACQYCVVLALAAVTLQLLIQFTPNTPPNVHGWAPWVAFPLAIGLSIVFFGLCPAGVIPSAWQKWIATLAILGLGPLFALHLAWKSRRAGRLRFSLLDVFALMTLVCLTLGAFSLFANPESSWRLPLQLDIPSRSAIPGLSEAWAAKLKTFPLWWQVTLHWLAYYAQFLTLAIWALLLGGFCLWQTRTTRASKPGFFLGLHRFAVGYLHTLARSSLILLGTSLLLYLALAPSVIQMVEDDYQWRMSFARRPQWHLDGAKSALETLKADSVRMAEIIARIDKQMAQDDARGN